MPFGLEKRGEQWCVVRIATETRDGETKKCYGPEDGGKEAARKFLAALRIHGMENED